MLLICPDSYFCRNNYFSRSTTPVLLLINPGCRQKSDGEQPFRTRCLSQSSYNTTSGFKNPKPKSRVEKVSTLNERSILRIPTRTPISSSGSNRRSQSKPTRSETFSIFTPFSFISHKIYFLHVARSATCKIFFLCLSLKKKTIVEL